MRVLKSDYNNACSKISFGKVFVCSSNYLLASRVINAYNGWQILYITLSTIRNVFHRNFLRARGDAGRNHPCISSIPLSRTERRLHSSLISLATIATIIITSIHPASYQRSHSYTSHSLLSHSRQLDGRVYY